MAQTDSSQGIARTAAWVPTQDPERDQVLNPTSASRAWNAFGLNFSGHTIGVNVATGGLTVAATDLSIPYYSLPFRVLRTFDAQEQYIQNSYLDTHPNTDPRFHFFGNWQLQQEAHISPTWNHTFPEILVNDGDGESALFSREYNDFEINTISAASVEERLCAYGIPGRTLTALGWVFSENDCLLCTKRGGFGILTGNYKAETMVDPVELRLWRFEPITGMAYKYTSEFAYQWFIDTDGMRETNVQTIMDFATDGLGHNLTFQPMGGAAPYRSYRIADGAGRSFRMDLADMVTYLDGNRFEGKVKVYLVSTVTDETKPALNTIDYQYDNGNLIQVSYPGYAGGAARIVKYDYDSAGNMVRITDPVGDALNFEYIEDLLDSDDLLVPRLKISKITDAEGNAAVYKYDHPSGKVTVSFIDADLSTRSISYDYIQDTNDTGQRYIVQSEISVALGYSGNQIVQNKWVYSDDGRFQLLQAIDPLGNISAFEYNRFNQRTAVIDSTGHRKEFQYDLQDVPTAAQPNHYDLVKIAEDNVDINGTIFKIDHSLQYWGYDNKSSGDANDNVQSTHRIASYTDPNGNSTTFDYDDVASNNPVAPTLITDALGKTTKKTIDNTGNLLSATDALGNNQTLTYNLQGQRLGSTDANGNKKFWTFDPATGWLTDITDALGVAAGDPSHSSHYDWNDAGQLIRKTDPLGDKIEYSYFRNKRVLSITQFDPQPQKSSFAYNTNGALTVVTDPVGHMTLLLYDEAGRIFETFRDLQTNPSIRCIMDASGRTTSLIDRNGQTTQYVFDSLNRVIQIQEPSWPAATNKNAGKTILIDYDNLGLRLKISDSQLPGPYLYNYYPNGNLINLINPFNLTLDFKLDGRNDLIQLIDGSGAIDIVFDRDSAGNLSTVTDAAFIDPSRSFKYFRKNGVLVDNLYQIKLDSSGIQTNFAYDANDQLTAINHQRAANPLLMFGYNYDADGLKGQLTGNHIALYTYSGMKRLVGETDTGLFDGYDNVGNRLWRAANPVVLAQQNTYDQDNRLTTNAGDGSSFKYDNNGNLIARTLIGGQIVRYNFDGANRLMSVENPASMIEYLYDIDGRLLQRTITQGGNSDVERYFHANLSILATTDDQDNISTLYTRDDEGRLLRKRTNVAHSPANTVDPHSLYYLYDGLRNICGLVDWYGHIHLNVDYDAWGNFKVNGEAAPQEQFLYREGFFDQDVQLTNFGARWYDAVQGRWISQDPFFNMAILANADIAPLASNLMNLYLYVSNNPINRVDPLGLDEAHVAATGGLQMGPVYVNFNAGLSGNTDGSLNVYATVGFGGNLPYNGYGGGFGVTIGGSDAQRGPDIGDWFNTVGGGLGPVSATYFWGDSPDGVVHGLDFTLTPPQFSFGNTSYYSIQGGQTYTLTTEVFNPAYWLANWLVPANPEYPPTADANGNPVPTN